MFRSIVVGTDGSPTAQEAVRKAVELARSGDATLHVVAAYRPVTTSSVAAMSMEAISAGGLEVLQEAQSAVASEVEGMLSRMGEDLRGEGVDVEVHPLPGDPADVIIELAEAKKADLIVVGSVGMSGAKRFLLGSVPNKITHHAPCSVLVIKTG